MKFQLLYFDDQIQNIECFQAMLKEHFVVTGSTEGETYPEILKKIRPHGIILDLHMPVMDGVVLYDKIISSEDYNGCPIFFISGDVSAESRLKTMQTGSLDFFTRQMSHEELSLRLTNKIKLYLQGNTIIDVGNLRLDTHSFSILIGKQPTDLTLIEMRILSYVLRKMPDPVHKNELMQQIWGSTSTQGKMNTHLSNIKLKLSSWNHEMRIRDNLVSITPNQ